jgi:hypothetical protein
MAPIRLTDRQMEIVQNVAEYALDCPRGADGTRWYYGELSSFFR